MSDRVLTTVLASLHDWGCPANLYGTAALLQCAARAVELEKQGEPWSPFRVCQKYAEEKDMVQHSVWVSMCYALERSSGPKNPAAAMRAIVKGAYKNGTIDSD